MFAVKNYQQGVQRLLAACDEELLGGDYREGKYHLQVAPGFYDGLRVDEAGLAAYLQACTIANLVGPRTVQVAIGLGLVDPAHVLTVAGVAHAQLLVMIDP